MLASFHAMEESLKGYLVDALADNYNKSGSFFYKYNNLRIYMDPKKSRIPHFIIRVGMSEAIYDILSYEKIAGGLGVEGRYIKRWAERALSKEELSQEWVINNRLEALELDKKFKLKN